MSLMCNMGKECGATTGMCIHEKMMMGIAIMGAIAAIGHWVLHWF